MQLKFLKLFHSDSLMAARLRLKKIGPDTEGETTDYERGRKRPSLDVYRPKKKKIRAQELCESDCSIAGDS